MVPSGPIEELAGWRYPRLNPSLPESHATVLIPRGVSFWRKALAFVGPGYMVAVGYMDPGNWATDLAGGARFGYALVSVILLSKAGTRPWRRDSALPADATSPRPAATTIRGR